jgi:hypothetical protein
MIRNIILAVITVTAFAFPGLASPVIAQQNQTRTPESMVAQIEKAITLSAEQKTKLLELYKEVISKEQQSDGKATISVKETRTAVEKILTPDQMKKIFEYQLNQMVDAFMAFIDREVVLTGDQKEKITSVIAKELKSVQDYTWEISAKYEKLDRQALMEKINDKRVELRAVTDKTIESILTKEQFEKYKAVESRLK